MRTRKTRTDFTAEAPVGGDGVKDGSEADRDLEARLARLSRDLGTTSGNGGSSPAGDSPGPSEEMLRARSAGFRILGEFTAAIVAGVLIGFLVDRVAGTSPAFLIVFLILGTIAGFWNIYRIAAPPRSGPRA